MRDFEIQLSPATATAQRQVQGASFAVLVLFKTEVATIAGVPIENKVAVAAGLFILCFILVKYWIWFFIDRDSSFRKFARIKKPLDEAKQDVKRKNEERPFAKSKAEIEEKTEKARVLESQRHDEFLLKAGENRIVKHWLVLIEFCITIAVAGAALWVGFTHFVDIADTRVG